VISLEASGDPTQTSCLFFFFFFIHHLMNVPPTLLTLPSLDFVRFILDELFTTAIFFFVHVLRVFH
jgi:hypothetical protein